MGFGFDGVGMGFSIMPLFMLIFFGFFVVIIVKAIGQWSKNNNSPIVPVYARVAAKRQDAYTHTDAPMTDAGGVTHMGMTHHHTTYYATFEFENGERMELKIDGSQYSMLAEGDLGTLQFQGTRFISFERQR